VLLALKACVQTLRLWDELKYAPDQPRWPEGHPLGGQWKPKEGGEGEGYEEGDGEDRGAFFATENDSLSSFGEAPDGTLIEPVAGIPDSEKGSTVQSFMSRYCNAGIRSEMPGQFLGMTIDEVLRLAKQGDGAARTCLKLLSRGRFQK
jgi:hypothetical protein